MTTPGARSFLRDPVATTPPLPVGALRRTSHLDVGPAPGEAWMQPEPVSLAFTGEVRDTTHRDDRSEHRVTATLRATTDAHRVLVGLDLDPAIETGDLIGARVGPGFRRVVEAAHAAPDEHLASVLLFDLPTGALIAGYAELRSRALAGADPAAIVGPAVLPYVEEVCSGWRSDGHMVTSIRNGGGVPLQDCPDAPDLGAGWHALPDLTPGWLRRRRRIDLLPDGGIDAMFRDSYGEPDGRETVLHEYAVTARVERGALLDPVATPRVLPFEECPWAAENVAGLAGVAGSQLRAEVRDRLAGTAGCTHMNDLVACIGDLLAGRGG